MIQLDQMINLVCLDNSTPLLLNKSSRPYYLLRVFVVTKSLTTRKYLCFSIVDHPNLVFKGTFTPSYSMRELSLSILFRGLSTPEIIQSTMCTICYIPYYFLLSYLSQCWSTLCLASSSHLPIKLSFFYYCAI